MTLGEAIEFDEEEEYCYAMCTDRVYIGARGLRILDHETIVGGVLIYLRDRKSVV